MARYRGTVEAPHSAEAIWQYLADLRSAAQWDPSVESVKLTSGKPRSETARYELVVRFGGRGITLPYRVVEISPPSRVVFAAETDAVSVRDEARIEPTGAGTSRVTWAADLRLRGLRKVFELPLRALFNRLGEKAKRGLNERLGEPALQAPGDRVTA
ncbi:MAG TPA: SRPBCC family protein [Solirubrobacterales bacterium]|jgi:carbon monoxide dehydrogenase subunit G|nr:SRPBCC family protein [Solirubrobacterales bacterium]